MKRVDIAWPSRRTESWYNLKADGEYLMIEGVERTFRLDRIGLTSAEADRQKK